MEFFPVDGPWAGRLAVMSRPRGSLWLAGDLQATREAGFEVLISALTPREVESLQLGEAPGHCRLVGLEFVHFPIGNLQVPDAGEAMAALMEWHSLLAAGRGVAVHCWGGIGRSPLIAASLLALGGVEAGEAWERVEAARGRPVPDTREQREWVFEIRRRLESGDGRPA